MKKKKLLFAILCALGSGTVGFFANQLTEVYGCIQDEMITMLIPMDG